MYYVDTDQKAQEQGDALARAAFAAYAEARPSWRAVRGREAHTTERPRMAQCAGSTLPRVSRSPANCPYSCRCRIHMPRVHYGLGAKVRHGLPHKRNVWVFPASVGRVRTAVSLSELLTDRKCELDCGAGGGVGSECVGDVAGDP